MIRQRSVCTAYNEKSASKISTKFNFVTLFPKIITKSTYFGIIFYQYLVAPPTEAHVSPAEIITGLRAFVY